MRAPLAFPDVVAGEVRAEMARQTKRVPALAELLNLSYASARARYLGRHPLTMDELFLIALWLEVDMSALVSCPHLESDGVPA